MLTSAQLFLCFLHLQRQAFKLCSSRWEEYISESPLCDTLGSSRMEPFGYVPSRPRPWFNQVSFDHCYVTSVQGQDPEAFLFYMHVGAQ